VPDGDHKRQDGIPTLIGPGARAHQRSRWRNWAAAAAALAGMIAFMVWCHGRYGDALAFAYIQGYHSRHLSLLGPLVAFFAFESDPDYYLVTLASA
jgi:hypothetical protein